MKKKPYRLAKMRSALDSLGIRLDPDGLHLLARLHLAETEHHLSAVKARAKKKTRIQGESTMSSDLPSELGSYSDGVTDDATFTPEIIGCGMPGVSGGIQHFSIAGGLNDLAVAGLPSYLFSRKNLSNPVVRQRLAENIKALTPKVRRRVLARLRTAVSVARVSGAVRGAYPTINGCPNVGWSGITVSGSRGGCPFANVAGALTP